MEVKAIAKYIRVSPRKMDLLVRGVKHMAPNHAVVVLEHTSKSGAKPLRKVIASALANATQKNIDQVLQFKTIEVLSAGGMKRHRPVSRGMAHSYKKRMSHVKVVLTDEKVNEQVKIEKKENKSS